MQRTDDIVMIDITLNMNSLMIFDSYQNKTH